MKSAICLPFPAKLKAGQQNIVGYAWSPFGKITKVDVSMDGGSTFNAAMLTGPNIERAGTRWTFSFSAQPGNMTITPRATDEQGNVQYPISEQKWNQLGYIFGAMVPHPVEVTT
jgi:sulfane dehydrogenase subunit SoxC